MPMLFTLIYLTSLLIVAFAIPPIITVSLRKRLFDDPNESRKIHKRIIPNFGGVAIFTGFLFSCSIFIPSQVLPEANVLMAGGLVLFMIGLKDDIIGLGPGIKFVAQFLSACIVAIVANIRISDLHGVFGVYDIPYYASITLTVFFIVGIVNAFNLIDGIDGLAGSIGLVLSMIFGVLFYKSGDLGWAYLATSLAGALLGFLFFNVTPARIFMGDSGSLLLGFIAAVLSIKFINVSLSENVMTGPFQITSGIGLVSAILIIPVFDTLRVFTLRILRGTSPFTADSNHIHHRLLSLGLSHVQATLVLSSVNVVFIIAALSLQNMGDAELVSFTMLLMLTLNGILSLFINRFKKTASLAGSVKRTKPARSEKSFAERVLEKISEN
ncbi:undecaprenyl-phosphate alpha-N-acetylglucosaminyl 1-phosphate transferase [Pedobacter ginsengisoli]|uniref:Undecaprenyl-phosphate alpha-N-acetylglucosaminyl 1-phosphate transferase n=1 Tax=Pedobacter ginsengisoli TaxID=363852 RepID=A0A2D1U8P8_9SPHI|nr:MraY family glycosyltransferase [Pedobacter ginsengisoli]ATP57988.1 undecaprenyl-phosphate alpha-N-acetylglucosaminyl 1-phosphate transferase [Pedobacter ginsengisoli]